MKWRLPALLMLSWSCLAADARVEALQAIFPGMDVVATTRHRDDSSKDQWMTDPDAFAAEPIYQVNGPASNQIERCASEDVTAQRFSQSREVRLRLFPWPRTRADFAAVLQYDFIGAKPAGSCWSVGMLVHLGRRGTQWEVVERQLVQPQHHTMFAGVQMVDLTGDGVEELVVEPNSGGAGTTGTSLLVFDLSGRRFRQIFETQSRLEYRTDDSYSQTLDAVRSAASAGQSVCFELTVFVKNGKTLPKPRVSQECYPTSTSADRTESKQLNDWLRPLSP